MDPLVAMKQRRLPWGTTRNTLQKMNLRSVVLPFGWATRTATSALPRLWSAASKECRSIGTEPTALIVTSPHYAPLVQQLSEDISTFYYCSDDYLNYSGWDADRMREQEALIVRQARHSFFVSAALRERAVREYGVDATRVAVSMNATDEEFLSSVSPSEIERLLQRFPKLKRPIAGVIGGINERLDYALLLQVAELSELGTLLLVGPIADPNDAELAALLKHPRVVAVGHQPHESLPIWQQMLDVALIPYRESAFNRFCSPLRLFDHLAVARPIVATAACEQVHEFGDWVKAAKDTVEFLAMVVDSVKETDETPCRRRRECAAQHTWKARASAMDAVLGTKLSQPSL